MLKEQPSRRSATRTSLDEAGGVRRFTNRTVTHITALSTVKGFTEGLCLLGDTGVVSAGHLCLHSVLTDARYANVIRELNLSQQTPTVKKKKLLTFRVKHDLIHMVSAPQNTFLKLLP